MTLPPENNNSGLALTLKPPRPPFPATIQAKRNAFFLHPGYEEGHNILLALPALDSGGIHHETARIACAILANSRWDGFLSQVKDGPRLEHGPDDVLPCGRYYFRIDGGMLGLRSFSSDDSHDTDLYLSYTYASVTADDQYPVVPSFDNFRCPPELPDSWSNINTPIQPSFVEDVGKRHLTCRVTGSLLPNETAYIIPQTQSEWWQRNSMFTYAMNPDQGFDPNCADNTILLRRDLHKMWDDHRFAIVPKAGKWVVHILLSSSTVELEETYHNLELQSLHAVSRQFFFCRFALAILSKSPFLRQFTSRRLMILASSGSPQVRTMSADEYQLLFNNTTRGNSSSQGPKKRQRPVQGENEVFEPAPSETDSEPEEDDEPERGRSRKRRSPPSITKTKTSVREPPSSRHAATINEP